MFSVFTPKLWNWCFSLWLFFFHDAPSVSLRSRVYFQESDTACHFLPALGIYRGGEWVNKDAPRVWVMLPPQCNRPLMAAIRTGGENGVSKTMKGQGFTSRSVGSSRCRAEAISPTAGAFCRYSNCFVISKRQIV